MHSTACNQTDANVFIKKWNAPGIQKAVHAFIDANGVYQTLPFTTRPWGCGKGKKGSYNNTHIQFEICEDDLKGKEYFDKVYNLAVDFCVYLCKHYGIKTENIVCHSEAHELGYASNHADVMHWFPKFRKSMDTFRADVKKKLKVFSTAKGTIYTVKTKLLPLICRASAKATGKKVGSFNKGAKVTLIKKVNHTWYEVKGTGIRGETLSGFVAAKYLG